MLKVALTGGIATGKSHVLNYLRERGVPCLDADALVHGVMAAGTEATQAIATRFGDGMLDPSGAVDRRKLGPLVFADQPARRDLEAIVHPAVYRAIAAGVRAFELGGDAWLTVVDIPLLFETGHWDEFDKVVATVCPPEIQLARLTARGLTNEEASLRVAAQMPAEEKAARADFVIRTGGTFDETNRQIDDVLRQLHAYATGS